MLGQCINVENSSKSNFEMENMSPSWSANENSTLGFRH